MTKHTGYPSIDRTHLKGTKLFERRPLIPDISVSNAIDLVGACYPQTPAIDCLDLKATHRQLREDSYILARAFAALGVKAGGYCGDLRAQPVSVVCVL